MRSAAFRATIGATAWIALGVAGILLYRTDQQRSLHTASLRTFDRHAREATDALVDARVAQEAYIATGQGLAFWMPKVSASSDAAQAALTALRETASAAAQTPLDQAAGTLGEFVVIDKRVREYLKSGQGLMAGDVIFTEGSEAAASAARQIDAAKQAEHQAFDAQVALLRKQEAMIAAAAAAVAGIAVLLLVPAARRRPAADAIEKTAAAAPAAAQPAATPPHTESSSSTEDLKTAAAIATDFGRIRDLDDLKATLGKAANAMDASGVMVWMGAPGGGDLRVVLAHGYGQEVLTRIRPVSRSADNAAAKAYRSGTLQIVLSRPGASTGAVVAPIMSGEGCVGALSAEIRHGAETSDTVQALAEIAAAHLAGVLGQAEEEPAAHAAQAAAT